MVFFKWSAYAKKHKAERESRMISIQNTVAAIQLYSSNLQARAFLSLKSYQHISKEKALLSKIILIRNKQQYLKRALAAWKLYRSTFLLFF